MADELLLSIEKLIYGGGGLAHADGNTVFVPYVLPGEQVRAEVRTRKKKLIHANLVKVEQTAAARIAAPQAGTRPTRPTAVTGNVGNHEANRVISIPLDPQENSRLGEGGFV